ncbi:LacI family DNA-binding transcriptional regulator [Mahella sp.]|uniref:LacI family DNA-binding transcriptional regulator n=1 Tax=Mahella sp. TaxID=2798721 RepID=UPI0025BD882D|nr:LacI family DNA-binding transcriptional regulator [Mahella sp.]MBZ4665286.1 transcriptional regulator, LacI family [Mahella sp.]
MVTIKDVAKKAGVSISTASYALNNSGPVSAETKERVIRAAEELKYRPNGNARDLKSSKTNTIGLIVSDLAGPFFSELIRGVQEATLAGGYDLMALSAIGGFDSTAAKFLKEKRTDAMVIFAHNLDDSLIKSAARQDMPIALLDRRSSGKYIINIEVDNFNGAYKAVEYLISLGYSKIAYISGSDDSYDNIKRFDGYKAALKAYGIEYTPKLYYNGNFVESGGYQAAKLMLFQNDLPQAIFAANDEMAIGAMEAFDEAGLKVGRDIAIIGFDDIRLAQYVNPPLTTIKQPVYEMGCLAVRLLMQALQGDFPNEEIILPAELIIRKSCGEA